MIPFERTLLLPVAGAAVALVAPLVLTPGPIEAQGVGDPGRLSGIEEVELRVDAQWDELITREAGGATEDQFLDALRMSFTDALAAADPAPAIVDDTSVGVVCHVDTFYDTGLIVYALRVQAEEPDEDGRPVITWIESSVGSYTVQQLHLMFRLGERCAERFLEAWRSGVAPETGGV